MIKASVLAQTVKDLAIEQPTAHSASKYFDKDGSPCCIVGHGLARLGVDTEPFTGPGSRLNKKQIGQLGQVIDFDTQESKSFLVNIQSWQDLGYGWRDALDKSERKAYPPFVQ